MPCFRRPEAAYGVRCFMLVYMLQAPRYSTRNQNNSSRGAKRRAPQQAGLLLFLSGSVRRLLGTQAGASRSP